MDLNIVNNGPQPPKPPPPRPQNPFNSAHSASESGNKLIARPADLNCAEWSAAECKWRNEPNTDQFDWASAKGSWDVMRGNVAFGTPDQPAGSWAITGSPTKMDTEANSMLVSDPIPCQPEDAQLDFKYWTTPGATIRVCTRKPNNNDDYLFCSPSIGSGDPGPARVTIPGSSDGPFEIVLEAKGFTYDNFGVKGGAVVLDDVTYKASDFAGKCINGPNGDGDNGDGGDDGGLKRDKSSCDAIACNFESGACLDRVIPGAGWRIQDGPFGNRHTGIREEYSGSYAVARGPNPSSLSTGPFTLISDEMMGFCFYRPGALSDLIVRVQQGGREEQIYKSSQFNPDEPQHTWQCEKLLLAKGSYDKLEFVAEGLLNEYTSLGLDSVEMFEIQDPNTPIC